MKSLCCLFALAALMSFATSGAQTPAREVAASYIEGIEALEAWRDPFRGLEAPKLPDVPR